MATTILSSLIVLLQLMCVIIVAACLLTGSRFFPEVLEGRLRDVISGTRGMDSKTIMDKILDEVNEFCGDYPQSDDITLMIIRVGEQ